MRTLSNVLAIVISYNPDEGFLRRCQYLLAQFNELLIVDNASQAGARARVEQVGLLPRTNVIWNQTNLGIAAALNQGVVYAKHHGFEWVGTFDQDSTSTEGYVENLLKVAEEAKSIGEVALVAPFYVDEASGTVTRYAKKYVRTKVDGLSFGLAMPTITSGNLIRVNTFNIVGLFDESLFIDLVDYDFCFRCAEKGLIVVEAKDVSLKHNLGRTEQYKILFRTEPASVSNHSAIRRYYSARNRVIIYRKYCLIHARWFLRDLRAFSMEIVKIVFFEDNKSRKLAYTARGLMHGLLGRTGPAPSELYYKS